MRSFGVLGIREVYRKGKNSAIANPQHMELHWYVLDVVEEERKKEEAKLKKKPYRPNSLAICIASEQVVRYKTAGWRKTVGKLRAITLNAPASHALTPGIQQPNAPEFPRKDTAEWHAAPRAPSWVSIAVTHLPKQLAASSCNYPPCPISSEFPDGEKKAILSRGM